MAKAVNDFLARDLIFTANPSDNPDREVKLRDVLDRAAEKINGRLTNQPLVDAAIRFMVGETFRFTGELDRAEPLLRRAVEIRTIELGSLGRAWNSDQGVAWPTSLSRSF